MPPTLPFSLSPHICIISSPDLDNVLNAASLPPLPQLLQSFSPFSQVTTRTTSLTSVPHASFALRFSNLLDIEAECKEEEEERAVRTVDWIGSRLQQGSPKWVEELSNTGERQTTRTPWWDELHRCIDGDHVPSKSEGWNHPVAVIFAVSTTAPNPLQAITALQSRTFDLPPWIDPTILRYTLIVHPQNSSLSDEEAGALFNAVKKQYGLHSYLLPLTLPSPPPLPVPVPPWTPRLPPPPRDTPNSPASAHSGSNYENLVTPNTLRFAENDIRQTAKFTREFLVMSLLPWMERCVIDWNENFSSTRRLPSRLFSSTRRLFGTSPSPSPVSSTPLPMSASLARNASITSQSSQNHPPPPSQHRRLAEFATILGDYKLAVSVWETLRKEGKGGSDILPLLLSPSPTLQLYASAALQDNNKLGGQEPSPLSQIRAVRTAIRWYSGIPTADFIGSALEGEQWLVWAAGNAEEIPAALLLGHAALLSNLKGSRRRAALWYLFAAERLEKCGIKPLTMLLLRKTRELYNLRPALSLSPSFWDAHGMTPLLRKGFDAIEAGIDHPLGRLLYLTGDVSGAVHIFLSLLKKSSTTSPHYLSPINGFSSDHREGPDKLYLDDFRVAFSHYTSNLGDRAKIREFRPSFSLCIPRQTRVRFPRDHLRGRSSEWQQRREHWNSFQRKQGNADKLADDESAVVDEAFWVDVHVQNPLEAEVNVSNLTLVVVLSNQSQSSEDLVEAEVIDDVVLGPLESRTIPVSVVCRSPGKLEISAITYDFLSLLPVTESLACRGRRLHDTAAQRQTPTYAPDVLIHVHVAESKHQLLAQFSDDGQLVLAHGECVPLNLWFSNAGKHPITEIWMIPGPDDSVTLGEATGLSEESDPQDLAVVRSENSIAIPIPRRLSIGDALLPGDSIECPVVLHANHVGNQELCVLFAFRGGEDTRFYSVRASRFFEVQPLCEVSATARPSHQGGLPYQINVEVRNITASIPVQLDEVVTVSPSWRCTNTADTDSHALVLPLQSSRVLLNAGFWNEGQGIVETSSFVRKQLKDVINGIPVEATSPPPIDLIFSRILKSGPDGGERMSPTAVQEARRQYVSRLVSLTHPHIPSDTHSHIFPLYHPSTVDLVLSWRIPEQARFGHITVSGLHLGAAHAPLADIIDEAENAKVKRNMYAETQKEKMEVLESVRNCEWNMEMDPIALLPQDKFIGHNFADGSCQASSAFLIRNLSTTHSARFVLRFNTSPSPYQDPASTLLPPVYTGRFSFRGVLGPLQSTTVHPSLWVTRPGAYSLGGWTLDTEVENPQSDPKPSRSLRYHQEAPLIVKTSLVVYDTRQKS